MPPALNQVLIDEVIRPARQDWLLPVIAVLIGSTIAGLVLQWFYQLIMAHLQTALASSLTDQLGRRLLRLPLEFIESRSRADLMQRVNSYAGLGTLLTRTTLGLFDVIFFLALAVLMLAYDSELAALALGIDLLRVFVVRFVREDSRQRSAGELMARERESSVVLQATSSAETVKAFGLENRLEAWYRMRLYERLHWTVKSLRLSEGASRWLSIFDGVARAVVLGVVLLVASSLDGLDLRFDSHRARARNLVLYVPQHCKLFETSIRENLELLSGASRAELARVAALTGLSRMLARLPMRDETLVAAQGQNLSSGQRQLIVLTAAFASSRPVLLLDEATNQIDAETRAAFAWPELLDGRTVISVEHG